MNPAFQHSGTWYDFFSGNELVVSDPNAQIVLSAGEFHIYTDQRLHQPDYDIITSLATATEAQTYQFYPNPATTFINIAVEASGPKQEQHWVIRNILGQEEVSGIINSGEGKVDISHLKAGIYIIELANGATKHTTRLIKQ